MNLMQGGAGPTRTGPSSTPGGGAPFNEADPPVLTTIDSPFYVGEIITVLPGTWNENGGGTIAFSYVWKRSGVVIEGATNDTYEVTTDDEGLPITCTVEASNTGGSASLTTESVGSARNMTFNGAAGSSWDTAASWQLARGVAESAPQSGDILTIISSIASGTSQPGLNFPSVTVTGGGDVYWNGSNIEVLDFTGGNLTGNLGVVGQATFRGGSKNYLTPVGAATSYAFEDNAENHAELPGPVHFGGNSKNNGVITGNATFEDATENTGTGGTVSGYSVFRNVSVNNGTVADAEWHDGAQHRATSSGTQNVYYPVAYPFDFYGGAVSGDVIYHGYILGCTNMGATNYDENANTDDGSCFF